MLLSTEHINLALLQWSNVLELISVRTQSKQNCQTEVKLLISQLLRDHPLPSSV